MPLTAISIVPPGSPPDYSPQLQIQNVGRDPANAVPKPDFLEKSGTRKVGPALDARGQSTLLKASLGVLAITALFAGGIASFTFGGPIGVALYLAALMAIGFIFKS